MGSLDIGVKMMILKEKVSIRITMVDLLNTQRWQQRVQFANMDFTYRRKRESCVIRLQFGWSFGKSKYQAKERKTNEDANRIKVKS